MKKEYKNEQIVVHWFPELCTHPGTCLRLLPEVFDNRRRPWVDVNAANPEAIMRTIDECPSGALRYSLPEGSAIDPALACGVGNLNYRRAEQKPVTIKVSKDGPFVVEGHTILSDCEGNIIKEDCKMALCRCGLSKNQPFCDAAHLRQGWKQDRE